MRVSGQKLTHKQELTISALLTCDALSTAASQAGIAEATLYRWLKEETFQDVYREARRQLVQQSIAQVQRATGEAVETLREVMHDPLAAASARVAAARAILDTAFRGIEAEDMLARIEALEQVARTR